MKAKTESASVSPEKLALYNKLIATIPNLERKGATMPYTSLNGHMFSVLDQDGFLSFRLPQPARDEFLAKYKSTLRKAYGIVLKEYVVVPDKLLKNTRELSKYFALSYEYVSGLKPKPTKKSGAAKKGNAK